ncbi:MAG: glycosyltransferase family 4 protein [Desulfuromonadales bacterium]|nr:glycosyltransferase family 4 protein [Desulfuromonadales bacterium]
MLLLSLELRRKGHYLGFFLREYSVTVRRFEKEGFPVWYGRRRGIGLIASVFKLSSVIRAERFDLIHIHRSHDIIPTALANFASGLIPMVLTQHAWEFSKSCLQYLVFGTLKRIVAVSEAVAGRLREMQPYIADKTVVIHNGVPIKSQVKPDPDYWTRRFELTGTEPLLGIVGFFHKNQQELIGLLPKIRETFPDVKLILIGAVDDRKQMFEEHAARLGVLDALFFAGFIPHEEMHDALGSLYLNISMHRHEPFGLHVVEGMAAGTPLVAYRAGGFPEIVEHERNGYLAESQEELLQAILALLRDRDKRTKMGQSGRERVLKLFTPDRMVSDYEALYLSIKK